MTKRIQKKSTHGGARKGAGAKPKDPSTRRIMWSGRLHPDTAAKLRTSSSATLSQAEIVDQAVAQWSAARNGVS